MKKLLLIAALLISVPTMTMDAGLLKSLKQTIVKNTKKAGKKVGKKAGKVLADEFVTSLEKQTGKNIKHHKKGSKELKDLPKGYVPESRLEKLNKHYKNGGKAGTIDIKKEMKKENKKRIRAERRQAKNKK